MKTNVGRPMGRLFYWPLMIALLGLCASHGWAQQKTLIADSLYRADGAAAQGTLLISWSAFTTANGDAVAAGTMNVKIGAQGAVSVALFPNTGSSPASSYKVTLKASDGTTSEEYWTVPSAATTTIGAVRSKVAPAGVAQQFIGRDYVDTKFAQLAGIGSNVVHLAGDEQIAGVKQFTISPQVPAPVNPQDGANKSYVDAQTLSAKQYTDSAPTIARTGAANAWTAGQTFTAGMTVGRRERDCRQDGVVADGATDDGPAINTCIANAYAGGYGGIHLPSGRIHVATPLNFTNISAMVIEGASSGFGGFGELTSQTNGTFIMCDTGAVCADFTGSSWITLRNAEFRTLNSYATPSQVGLLFGRDNAAGGGNGTFCYSQWNTLENVSVYLDHYPGTGTATSKGRIALYNIGAEHFTIKGGMYRGDEAAFFGLSNALAVASPYQTLQVGCPASMTLVDVGGAASFQGASTVAGGLGNSLAAIEFYGTQLANFNFKSFHAINSNSNSGFAINFNNAGGTATNFFLQGQLEGFPRSMNLNGNLDSSVLATTAVNPTTALVGVGAGISITNTKIALTQLNGTPQPIFSYGSANTFKGLEIHAGPNAGLGGIASGNITLMQSKVYMPGTSGNVSVATGSQYELIDDAGDKFIGGLKVDTLGLPGATSGLTTLQASAIAGTTVVTVPAATDTLVGKATSDVFTNKSFDTAGAGNIFKVNGTQISAVTGTGAAVLASGATLSSPTLTTPNLGVASGTSLDLGKVTLTSSGTMSKYNNIVTAGKGLGAIYGSASLTTQGASLTATNLYTATAGMHRVCYDVQVTRAATTSSSINVTIGWNNGSAQSKSSTTIASNVLNAEDGNCFVVSSAASQNITYATTYASSGTTTMQYSLKVTAEQLQ